MATDRALPDRLMRAALAVDNVESGLRDEADSTRAVTNDSKWQGSSSLAFRSMSTQWSRELGQCAGLAGELDSALRRAAKSASQRIYYEDQERERLDKLAKQKRESQ